MKQRLLVTALFAFVATVASMHAPVQAAALIAQSAPSPSATTSAVPGTVKPAQSAPSPTARPSAPSTSATASAAPAPAATPAATATPTKPLVFSGYGDAAYTHFSDGNLTPNYRIYDVHPDTFDLQGVNVKVNLNGPAGIGLTAESLFGTDADVIASYGTARTDGLDIPQLFVNYSSGAFAVDAGRFSTLAGGEVFESPSNFNYSRSFLNGIVQPFTHTGVRAIYTAPSGKYAVNVGLNNGWDDIKFNGKKKTFEFSAVLTPSPAVTLNLTTYNGQDFTNYAFPTTNAPTYGQRTLYDAVLTLKPTSALTLLANYDNGNQQNSTLFDRTGTAIGASIGNPTGTPGSGHSTGIEGIVDYQATPKYGIALRGETFHDGGGVHTGFDQQLTEGTATLAYTPSTPLLFRVEYRVDGSSVPTFSQYQRTTTRNHQNSFAIESAFKF